MSIVHVDKICVEVAKKFEMRTSGGGGGGGGWGWSVISDAPGRVGKGGGVKRGQILADVLYGWPLSQFQEF